MVGCRPDTVLRPLAERTFSIIVFIIGAIIYGIIYGNINQFISNLYASGLRYRKRMEELDEFSKFHNLSPALRNKIRNYVDFQWSVTKGSLHALAAQTLVCPTLHLHS